MGTTAREDISTVKKQLPSSKGVVFAPRTIQFAHQFVGGELSLNLLSLTTPTLLSGNGFVNASPQEIAGANLSVFGKNLKLSLSRGIELKPYVHYLIVNNNVVFIGALKDAGGALADEILFGEIQMAAGNAQIVGDVRFVRGTVEVLVGQTVVNLGERFKVNENPSMQIGDVKITRNGVRIYRNVGNAAASPLADGNFHEIDAGTGYGVSIELNEAPIGQSDIIEYEIGVKLASGDLALWDSVQKLQGSILALAQDAAQEFYGDQDYTRYLTVSPSELERKAYADLVIAQAARIADLEDTASLTALTPFGVSGVAANVWFDMAFVDLTSGEWDIYLFATMDSSSATTGTAYIGLSPVTGDVTPGALGTELTGQFWTGSAGNQVSLSFGRVGIEVNGTQRWYAKGMVNSANGRAGCRMIARRVKKG